MPGSSQLLLTLDPQDIPPDHRRGDGTAVAHLVGKDLATKDSSAGTIDGLELMG